MRQLARIAVRNVRRRPRRTLITAGAVAFGVAVITVAGGFVAFSSWGLRQSIVYGGLGHLQIVATPRAPRIAPDVLAAVRSTLRRHHGVEYQTARLEFQALIGGPQATVAASAVGVEIPGESYVRMLTTVRSGGWFTGSERFARVMIGNGLAERLGVQPRDVVSLIAYSDRGRMTAADLQVAGIFESGILEYDARTILVPLATAQDLIETAGVTGLAVTLRDSGVLESLAEELRHGIAQTGVRVATWHDLSPIYDRVVVMYEWVLHTFMVVVGIIITLGIANTMSMAVLERGREIGILRALGFGPGSVVAMFLFEAATIGGLGSAIGASLGAALCHVLTRAQLEMPPPPGYSHGYIVQVPLIGSVFAGAVLLATVAAVVAGVGPSLRCLRGEVSDALRAV